MRFEAFEIGIVKDLCRRLFDRAIHALGLSVSPRVVGLGQLVDDSVCRADSIEHVRPPLSGDAVSVLRQVGEGHSIVCQD